MNISVLTSPGGREENQDAAGYVIKDCGVVACVCDGLGGHGGGRQAASAAKDAILVCDGTPGDAIRAANESVLAAQTEYPGMRTTALVLAIEKGRAAFAHCGDTRLYRIRAGQAEQMTLDHSVPEMLVRLGEIDREDIRRHEDRARLTRALGMEACRWDEAECDAVAGDVFLMATDGFWEPVHEEEMARRSAEKPEEMLRLLEEALLADATGRYDNYTALVVKL